MLIAFAIALLFFAAGLCGLPPLLSTLSIFILIPLFTYGIAVLGSPLLQLAALGILGFAALRILWSSGKSSFPKKEQESLALFLAVFAAALTLTHLWPNFFTMGEHGRDYALLAATIRAPISPIEPWLPETPLNYYLFWYRFAAFYAAIFGLSVGEAYHHTMAFSYAAFWSIAFYWFRVAAGTRFSWALLGSTAIALGSNPLGAATALDPNPSWWAPSRPFEGAITEFPAWSFLLGDLHPHYLNLVMLPLVCLLIFPTVLTFEKRWQRLGFLIFSAISLTPLFYQANSWESPQWLLLSGGFGAVLLFSKPEQLHTRRDLVPALLLIGLIGILSWALGRNIQPIEAEVKLVTSPVGWTELTPFLLHWGFPLFLIALEPVRLRRFKIFGLSLIGYAAAFAVDLAVVWTVTAIVTMLLCGIRFYRDKPAPAEVFFFVFGLAGLALITVPEVIFLDDPYGGAHERMNTIFKLYYPAWFLLWGSGFYTLRELALSAPTPRLGRLARTFAFALTAVSMLFFFRTVPLRIEKERESTPILDGASMLDQRYPGFHGAIKRLRELPPGVVLEAPSDPYTHGAMVATMGHQQSYLGWMGHLSLLYPKKGGEVAAQASRADAIYREPNCEKARELLLEEEIRYLVVGPLERKRYPGEAGLDQKGCLKKEVSSGQFTIYSTD